MTEEQKLQLSSLPSIAEESNSVLPDSAASDLPAAQERQNRSEMFGRGESTIPVSSVTWADTPSQARQLRTDMWGRGANEPASPPSAPAGAASSVRDGSNSAPHPAGTRRTRGG